MTISPAFDLTGARVWVAGQTGMVGSALVRRLASEPIAGILGRTSADLDLRRQDEVQAFVHAERPDVLLLAAARVGGIQANLIRPAEFLYDNLMIAANCLEAARVGGVRRAVVLGSSCVYPREAPQPIPEDALLTGPLEPTNEGYAVAKIAGLKLAETYREQYGFDAIGLLPSNLYGPHDDFELETAHVLPALLRKIHLAKQEGRDEVEIWGTGTPRREFLHVDDLADATIHALKHHRDGRFLNVGTGVDVPIRILAQLIADVVGWQGSFRFDRSMPDGTPRKLLDVSSLGSLGWSPSIGLKEGITGTYRWFLEHHPAGQMAP